MYTLFKKELNDFLNSLIGYIVITVFLLIIGLFLWVFPLQFNIFDNGFANVDGLFLLGPFVFLFLIPAITMRSFADEQKSGTIELLMTQPLTAMQVILAKFFAGVVLVLFSLLPTLIYVLTVYLLGLPPGNLDLGSIWGSYAGLLLLGAAFVSIGIFASSLADNQIVAFILAVFISFLAYIGFEFIYTFVLSGKTGLLIQSLGLNAHYSSMSRGVIDTRDLIYFLSVIALFILMTRLRLESRRWNLRGQQAIRALLAVAIILVVNVIASFIFTRVDLTAEKRYSLSPVTRHMLRELKDDVFFRVYLDGELPPAFRRLSNETREMLNEFRAYSDHIHYEFIDPSASPNARERNDTYMLLMEQGIQPTDLRVNKKGESSQLIIFPGAIISYQGREIPVQLLMTQMGQDPQLVLNNSIQGLEYNLGNAVDKLIHTTKPRVAILEGQGELSAADLADFEAVLSEYYNVERVTLREQINSLTVRLQTDSSGSPLVNKYAALIIAGPEKPFSEKDKFLIDQFIMRGGRVLWMVDPVFAKMDSLQVYSSTMGIANNLNLDDMLFSYGIRLNKNLVMDLSALSIPVKTGQIGDQPQFEFFPWYYFPLVTPSANHPVVTGLNAIKTEFISSIDTVEAPGVTKTVLLTSSPYSRIVNAPAFIDLEILRDAPDQRMYSGGPQPVAMLLEGEFTSAYLYRLPPVIGENKDLGVRTKSKPTRMVVVADGDLARSQFHVSQHYPLPMGYDQYTRQTFGNREFLLNVMNYLCDDSGLISIRSREVRLRLLDQTRVNAQRTLWLVINLLLPVLFILVVGIIRFQIRRRRYARKTV